MVQNGPKTGQNDPFWVILEPFWCFHQTLEKSPLNVTELSKTARKVAKMATFHARKLVQKVSFWPYLIPYLFTKTSQKVPFSVKITDFH